MRGLTTRRLHHRDTTLEIALDFVDHAAVVQRADGRTKSFELRDGLAMADFDTRLHALLGNLGLDKGLLAFLQSAYDGDFVSTWNTLEEFRQDGRARSIGVSNFQVAHLERLAAASDVVPAVNQIELHPHFLNNQVHAYGNARGIATQAWSPIAQGKVLGDPAIAAIAERLGKSPAQVVLRWHIQRGNIVFPKSTSPARIEENFELFDFQLEPGDVEKIDALDKGEAGRIGANPDVFAYIPPDALVAHSH